METWPWVERLRALGDVAEGLAQVHSLGYVFNDLSPHNILVDREGRCKIGDINGAVTHAEFADMQNGIAPSINCASSVLAREPPRSYVHTACGAVANPPTNGENPVSPGSRRYAGHSAAGTADAVNLRPFVAGSRAVHVPISPAIAKATTRHWEDMLFID